MDDAIEFLSQVPNSSLLVSIPPTGSLIRLHCPIQCECICASPPYLKGDIVQVQGVCFTKKEPLLYLITGKFHSHHNFKILNQTKRKP